ncbi:uncharacterized protein LOC127246842 isoform X6 [Andrographis paniculata]|uniref:uncharacterized protein LOC127246842 isoform X6 n=1 Tax=Andrographis paniculata TaxID=175694 RepID=UPI0021E74E48|nr:uncharacterized protein LOC127246842 isoform X6 [Andrographis paniculata]
MKGSGEEHTGLLWKLPEFKSNHLGKLGPAFGVGAGCGFGFAIGLIGGFLFLMQELASAQELLGYSLDLDLELDAGLVWVSGTVWEEELHMTGSANSPTLENFFTTLMFLCT